MTRGFQQQNPTQNFCIPKSAAAPQPPNIGGRRAAAFDVTQTLTGVTQSVPWRSASAAETGPSTARNRVSAARMRKGCRNGSGLAVAP